MKGARAGALLLELVVSASLLALVGVLVLRLLPAGYLSIGQSRSRLVALHLAQGEVELARASDFETLAPGETALEPVHERGASYRCTRSITAVNETLVLVTAQVVWHDALGSHRLEESAYVARLPR